MATTPNGSVVDEVNSGEDDPVPPRGTGRDDRGEQRNLPNPWGQHPSSGAGARHMGDTFQALQNPLAQ